MPQDANSRRTGGVSETSETSAGAETIARVGWRRDLRSKFLDGLLPALVLYLLIMQIVLPLEPILRTFGEPGLLVYTLGLLAVGMFSLQHALEPRLAESARAWYGMAAGMLSWSVVQISSLSDSSALVKGSAVMSVLLISLTVTALWRRNLPTGARFSFCVFLCNWWGSLCLIYFQMISSWSPILLLAYRVLGYTLAAGAFAALVWIFAFSERRIERMWASLVLVFFAAGAIFIFNGGLF